MNMDQTNDPRFRAAELGALLARHYPDAPHHLVARVVFDLQTAARRAKSLSTKSSNGELSPTQEVKASRWCETQAEKFATVFASVSLNVGLGTSQGVHLSPASVDFGGDPRGPCARLTIPGQRGDGWGEGFAVY